MSRVAGAKSAALALGLAKKSVAFIISNVRGFCELFRQTDTVMTLHAEYLSKLLEEVRLCKGLPDSFNADRFYGSFNGARATPGAKAASARCALAISKSIAPIFEGSWSMPSSVVGRVSVVATAGEAQCGNMGVEGMKKYCMIGLAQSYAHTLERHNGFMLTEVLIDNKVKQDVEQSHRVRQMVPIDYKNALQRAWQLVEVMQAGEDEWMYQLEEGAAKDPGKAISNCVETCIKNDRDAEKISEALEKLKQDSEKNPSEQHEIVARWMQEKLAKLKE